MDNKAFIQRLGRRLEMEPKDVSAMTQALSAVLREHCGALESVAIPGFGTFSANKYDEEIITDLSTGGRMLLPPRIEMKFVASSKLKKAVDNGK